MKTFKFLVIVVLIVAFIHYKSSSSKASADPEFVSDSIPQAGEVVNISGIVTCHETSQIVVIWESKESGGGKTAKGCFTGLNGTGQYMVTNSDSRNVTFRKIE